MWHTNRCIYHSPNNLVRKLWKNSRNMAQNTLKHTKCHTQYCRDYYTWKNSTKSPKKITSKIWITQRRNTLPYGRCHQIWVKTEYLTMTSEQAMYAVMNSDEWMCFMAFGRNSKAEMYSKPGANSEKCIWTVLTHANRRGNGHWIHRKQYSHKPAITTATFEPFCGFNKF